MKIEKVVVNASPLIILERAQLTHLLTNLFAEVVVPNAVWSEVAAGGGQTENVLPSRGVIQATIDAIPSDILVWNLGAGESEVLTYARQEKCSAVVDDRAARRCAQSLGIQTLGTGGILILAKGVGLVTSVEGELKKVIDAGLWLSDEMMDLILRTAGERTD